MTGKIQKKTMPIRRKKSNRTAGLSVCAITANRTALAALRGIMLCQLGIITGNAESAIRDSSPMPLHDIRVAMRRFRTALKAVIRITGNREAERLERSFAKLFRALGPFRDAQVWRAYLRRTMPGRRALSERKRKFLAAHERKYRGQLSGFRRMMKGRMFSETLAEASEFLRVRLPDLALKTGRRELFTQVADERIGKTRRRLRRKYADMKLRDMSPDALHNLRCRCRRLRYWAEFAALVPNSGTRLLAMNLAVVTGSLGRIHDTDTNLAQCRRPGVMTPASLARDMKRRRRKAMRDFKRAWRTLIRKLHY